VIGNVTFEYGELGTGYVYSTAFHWSMAQMTLGAIEVIATNTFERVANIGMLIIGLIFSSTLVSSLSATLIGYQMHNSEIEENMSLLRTYLRERCVDSVLALRVRQQCEHRIQQRAMILEEKVGVLNLLSPSLHAELRGNIFKTSFMSHPLFRLWGNYSVATLRELTSTVMDFKFHNPPDDVFVAGTGAAEAYYLVSGELNYTQYPESSVVKVRTKTVVPRGAWLCEAALWSEWIHVGSAEASNPSQLLVVEADKVICAAAKHRFILELTLQYGRQFHRCVVSGKPPHSVWPDDLHVPYTEWPDVVSKMDSTLRTTIGLDALSVMNPPPVLAGWASSKDELKQEVMDGRSTVLLNTEGDAERVVSVTALHIDGEHNEFLVQLAKWDGQPDSPIRAVVELPGSAQEMNEFPHEAAQRVLRTHFFVDPDLVHLSSSSREVFCKESPRYKVQTKYLKTTFRVRLNAALTIPSYSAFGSVGLERLESRRSSRKRVSNASELSLVGKRSSVGVALSNAARSAMMHSLSKAEKPTLSQILGDTYYERKVYAVRQDGKVTFYSWLQQREFQQLKEDSDKLICKWLSRLDMDPDILQNVENSASSGAHSPRHFDSDQLPLAIVLQDESSRSTGTIERTDPVDILLGVRRDFDGIGSCSDLRCLGDEDKLCAEVAL